MSKNGKKSTLKIIPLGGLYEIGKNTCVFEYDGEIILLDAGIGFPSNDMHGINIVLPDVTYLREKIYPSGIQFIQSNKCRVAKALTPVIRQAPKQNRKAPGLEASITGRRQLNRCSPACG